MRHELSLPDYAGRSQWLRAAVLGANDGIVSTASLILGVDAADGTRKDILIAAFAGWAAGATSMAAGEFVSVSSQADAEAVERRGRDAGREDAAGLPNPTVAASASAASYSMGAVLPVLTAALATPGRLVFLVPAVAIGALALLGAISARLGGAAPLRPVVRGVVSGAIAMGVTAAIGALVGGLA